MRAGLRGKADSVGATLPTRSDAKKPVETSDGDSAQIGSYIAELHERLPSGPYVTVFGTSTADAQDPLTASWKQLGSTIHGIGASVVSGGYSGAMEIVGRSAVEAGGVSVAVRAASLSEPADPRAYSHIVELPDVFERLQALLLLGDAYVVLPGGIGTLIEMACVFWQIDRGFMPLKPVVLLGHHWTGLLSLLTTNPLAFRRPATEVFASLVVVEEPSDVAAALRHSLSLTATRPDETLAS